VIGGVVSADVAEDCRLVDERRLRGVLERVVVGKSVVNGGAVLVAST